jgi:hypothetical protein
MIHQQYSAKRENPLVKLLPWLKVSDGGGS